MKRLFFRVARLFFVRRRPMVSANVRRILVIKLCCIGDILFTTPLLRALAANYPQAKVTYMVGSWCRELAAADPRVSDTITFDAYDRVSGWEKLKRVWKAIAAIRQGRFDLAFVLHRTPMAGCLAAAGGVRVRVGFDWKGSGFANTIPVPFRPDAHEVDRHLDCLKALGAGPEGIGLELTPPPEAQEAADEFLKRHRWNRDLGPLIALFPGGGVNPGTVMTTKRWPVAGYREVCRQLVRHFNARILLVGSNADKEIGDELLEGERLEPSVIRAEGKTSLLVLAALLKHCRLFIGGDSGPLHVAAAVGTATVSIFGPTDPALLAPRGRNHRVVKRSLTCAPCFTPASVRQGDDAGCRLGTVQCMREVTADEVLKAVEELLAIESE